jgi:hypothetical protein
MTPPVDLTVEHHDWKPLVRNQQAPALDALNHGRDVALRDPSGKLVGLSVHVQPELADMLPWLVRMLRLRLHWDDATGKGSSQARLSGIRYPSRVFGFTEPNPLRKRYGASIARLHIDQPQLGEALERAAGLLWALFEQYAPDEAKAHDSNVRGRIHPDWFMGGAPWTSGIINRTAALPYHRDAGNVVGSWSAMLTMRRNTTGGNLHLPEYDRTLAVDDATAMFFVGGKTWHGVTPIDLSRTDAYRFTTVFYAKTRLAVCGSAADEPARAARRATELTAAKRR